MAEPGLKPKCSGSRVYVLTAAPNSLLRPQNLIHMTGKDRKEGRMKVNDRRDREATRM